MNQPLVIDNGTGMTKAGFAGTDKPRVVFHSYVGRPKHQRVMNGGALEGCDVLIGAKADQHRGALILSYPIEHGMVQNWQDIERVWRHVYAKENMNVSSEDHAVSIHSRYSTSYLHLLIFSFCIHNDIGTDYRATVKSNIEQREDR